MGDNDGSVPPMPAHDPAAYSTAKQQLAYMQRRHADQDTGKDDGKPCLALVAAEAADLIVETIGCEDCRPASPGFVAEVVTQGGLEFAIALVFSLATSLVQADKVIAEGQAAYNRLPDDERQRVKDLASE